MHLFTSHRKKRPESRFNSLTQAQKDAAFEWCESASIRQGVLWLKDQFNLKVSRSVLGAWLRQQRALRSMASEVSRLRDIHDRASVIGNVVGTATPITLANSVLFAKAVFEEFNKPEDQRNQDLMVHYMELALTAREQELKASALELGFTRFQFNAARTALKHAAAPQSINASPEDERARIEAAVTLLFGKPPHMPELTLPHLAPAQSDSSLPSP